MSAFMFDSYFGLRPVVLQPAKSQVHVAEHESPRINGGRRR